MKRTVAWLFVALLTIGVIILISHRPEDRPQSTQDKIVAQSSNQPAHKVTGTQIAGGGIQAPQGISHEAMIAAYRERLLRSIEFYGKVLDEDGKPVEDAEVVFQWNTLTEEGAPPRTLKSDGSGLFTIQGIRGKSLDVRVTKNGYYPVKRKNQIAFEYAEPSEKRFHVPNPQSPVTFHLKKRGSGSELITSQYGVIPSLGIKSPSNGVPVAVNLLKRSVGGDGQLIVQGWKEPKDRATGRNNWAFRISVPDGGLVEHDDEFPFEAPETGYQQAYEWRFEGQTTNWQTSLNKNFYVKFGSPSRYGRIHITTSGFYPSATLDYAINPTGSRDLEFSSAVNPKQVQSE